MIWMVMEEIGKGLSLKKRKAGSCYELESCMKKSMIIMGICCIIGCQWACGQTAPEPENPAREADTTDVQGYVTGQGDVSGQKNEDNSAAAPWNDPELEAWKQVYLDYLDTLAGARDCAYSLIYVDDDEIPELAVDCGFDGGYARIDGGCRAVLTCHGHVLDEWNPLRSRFTYIERGNRICHVSNSYGENERTHSDIVFEIQDGKWVCVDGGRYSECADTSSLSAKLALWFGDDDYDWKLVREYSWGNTEERVSEAEYNTRLNAIYPEEQRIAPQNYYYLDDICSIMRTGNVASAGHRYELVVEDVTWEEAAARCREKGGYLATVTSNEEMCRIQEQVTAEEKTDITFFVGAKERNWLEHGTEELDVMILYTILDFWLDGELDPKRWQTEGEEALKNYFVLVYRESDERCYLGEELNDILTAKPSYAGKIGYICEYDS